MSDKQRSNVAAMMVSGYTCTVATMVGGDAHTVTTMVGGEAKKIVFFNSATLRIFNRLLVCLCT
jgi:hypothetical protein